MLYRLWDRFWHFVGRCIDRIEAHANEPLAIPRVPPPPRVPSPWPDEEEDTPVIESEVTPAQSIRARKMKNRT